MTTLAKPFANPRSLLKKSIGYSLAAGLIVLSLCGCKSEPPKKPDTLKNFFSQPRPE